MSTSTISRLEIRPAQQGDLGAVSELEESCFKDPYPPYFISQLFEANPHTFLVATVENKVVGYAVVDRWSDHHHLVSIAVHPRDRRRGIASRLLLALERGLEVGRPFKLEVRTSNVPALELYRRHGFKETGIITGYYSDGEDATVMEKS